MILLSYPDFRSKFAFRSVDTTAGAGFPTSFVDSNPDTITRPTVSGSYVTDGFVAGMLITVTGTALNDGVYRVESVLPQTLTLSSEESLSAETVLCTILGVETCVDGYEKWPYQNVRKPGSGFGDAGTTIGGFPKPWPTFSGFTVTCNAFVPDAVPGVDEYDWYISQRTENPAAQPLTIYPVIGGSSTLVVEPKADNFGKLVNDTITPDDLIKIFRNCHFYVIRKSDRAIQWIDMLRAQVANTP